MIELRPYQSQGVDQIRDAYRSRKLAPLYVSPTGSGKTVLFAYIAQQAAAKGNRVLILAHRAELLDQISAALDMPHGFIAAGYPASHNQAVVIASVQTIIRRLDAVGDFDLIVLDEAHHATATNTFGRVLARWPKARKLGVTATGRRPSGEPLGAVFDSLVLGPTVQQLTDAGYLARARIFAPPTVDVSSLHVRAGEYVQSEVAAVMDKPHVVGDAIDHYRKYADGKPAVCFCYSIEHSKFMAQAFRDAGYSGVHLDGNLERQLRRDMIRDFKESRIQVVCSVDVIGEGLDVPGIHCGILLRPTASETVYLQQVGRCLRPAPGKDAAVILDHARNTEQHGLPTEDREWTLEGRVSRREAGAEPAFNVKVCPKCFAAQRSGPPRCNQCGHTFEIESREVREVAGQLQELTPEQLAKRRARQQVGRAQTREELEAIARAKNYNARWVDHILEARAGKQRRTA